MTSIFDTTNHPIVPPFGAGNFAGVAGADRACPTGSSCPTRPRSACCRGSRRPAGCSRTPTSRAAASTRSRRAACCAGSSRPSPQRGYDYVAGLEIEFYVFRLLDPNLAPEQCGYPPEPPTVNGLAHGFQYLTENRNDEIHDLLWTLQEHTERRSACRC